MASRTDRKHRHRDDHEAHPSGNDQRPPARRDRDRILYCSAFRRLSGITQVVAPTEHYPTHNRLTHTLKVAQVGRSLAENLLVNPKNREIAVCAGGLDPEVVESAALAHDLGHPPFGHITERELDAIVTEHGIPDGYEGNAQSFRIVTKLAVRYPDVEGLDVTRATLNAILKYPWTRAGDGPKSRRWGAYRSEVDDLRWARQGCPLGDDVPSLEAALMDWADDVTYAVHDVEDFFRAGLIPLDRIVTDRSERDRVLQAVSVRPRDDDSLSIDDLARVFNTLMDSAPMAMPFQGSRADRATIRSYTSGLIDRYVTAISLTDPAGNGSPLRIDPIARMEVWMLKALTWYYVIESRSLVAQRFGQRRLIRALFDILLDASSKEEDWHVFPTIYQELLAESSDDADRVRLVADLIASMSEAHVVTMYHRLTGLAAGSVMDPVLP
ncbi:MAG: deoxyguanosinetriphosphate triphosphohydrolase family protein [Thermomicrobiales bacterium]